MFQAQIPLQTPSRGCDYRNTTQYFKYLTNILYYHVYNDLCKYDHHCIYGVPFCPECAFVQSTCSVIIHTNTMVLLPDCLVMVHLGCSYNIVNMNHLSFYWLYIGGCSWGNVGSHHPHLVSLCSVGVPSGYVLGPLLFALYCFLSGRY